MPPRSNFPVTCYRRARSGAATHWRGLEALKQVTSDAERERMAHGFRATMAAPGEEKLRDCSAYSHIGQADSAPVPRRWMLRCHFGGMLAGVVIGYTITTREPP
jgi:hypothetical protein